MSKRNKVANIAERWNGFSLSALRNVFVHWGRDKGWIGKGADQVRSPAIGSSLRTNSSVLFSFLLQRINHISRNRKA